MQIHQGFSLMQYEICERCDQRTVSYRVREAQIVVGELSRKPHLCEECTVTVMSVILAVLRPRPRGEPSTVGAVREEQE